MKKDLFVSIMYEISGAAQSRIVGKPCFKISKSASVCFFQNEMDFKLTDAIQTEALNQDGSQLFDPSGKKRPMEKWVQVPYIYSDKWEEFSYAALEYVIGN